MNRFRHLLFEDRAAAGDRVPGRDNAGERGPGLFLTVALILLSSLVLIAHYEITVERTDRAIFTFDSAEYAVAGRHLSRTGELRSPFVHPDALFGASAAPFPYMVGHPAVPVLNAVTFAALGERAALTLIPAGLSFILLVVLSAFFAFRLSGSRAVAAVAGCAIALHPVMLRYASEGLSEMPFMAAFIGALFLLWRMRDRPRPVLLGIVLGLAHLTRPMIVPLLPVWLAAAALMAGRKRLGTVGRVLAGFLPFAVLLAVHKYMAAGDPFADIGPSRLLTDLSPDFVKYQMHRYISPPPPLEYILDHWDSFIGKIASNAPDMLRGAFTAAGTLTGFLFVIYLVSPAADRAEKFFRATLVLSVMITAALVTVTVPSTRYFDPFIPVYLVTVIAEMYVLIMSRGFRKFLVTGLIALVVAFFILRPTLVNWRYTLRLRQPDRGVFTESSWVEFGSRLREILPGDAVTTSDVAPWVSWYADLPSVLLPVTPAENDSLDSRIGLDAIVLTNEFILDQPGNEAWKETFDGERVLEGWRAADIIRFGKGRGVVLLPVD